jgi:hypothetical protein
VLDVLPGGFTPTPYKMLSTKTVYKNKILQKKIPARE